MSLESKIPAGPLATKWEQHKFNVKLVNPSNKRKFDIIVVGTGLAGASAAATLAELGYNVHAYCFQDSPRRAHSIAAQGGINAAKNYQNDGDSVYRLFYDTIKGGDYRSREANVHRLAEVSTEIIDQCVAQGVPFARDYGGLLDNRSFGGAQVSRTFYARGQTGQQLLLGAYSALSKMVASGKVKMHTRKEMLDVVTIDGAAKGIVTRDLITGEIASHAGHAVLLCTGGYGNVFYLSTNAMASNASAAWRAYKKGAKFANPCFTQIHPTCIPVHGEYQSKLTLMSESLRNDGRVWVPKDQKNHKILAKNAAKLAEEDRDYYLERRYPSFGNLVPRDVASRNAKMVCDEGKGVGVTGLAVFLDFADAIKRDGKDTIAAKYGNLFDMYKQITNDDPYTMPMMIYPAVHYTMGGLWVDYNLSTNVPGLYALGEANFSDHGANRLGASALMQGLADGYFVIPYTMGDYIATLPLGKKVDINNPAFAEAEKAAKARIDKVLTINGNQTPDDLHKKLGHIMWEYCGMSRNKAGLEKARGLIQDLRKEFHKDLKVIGTNEELNMTLEKALRLEDFLDLGELMVIDAHNREESCGGHFREESQTEEGEALRQDDKFTYVSAWGYKGEDQDPELTKEDLVFENVKLTQRSYK
ncbi:fumarate reductase/succinate dehydrogenase flavoprotein subunit [Flammeovirga pectinis]|uniref:succinate dehydrogenase n=1 Tax=Flammeovirga pectinis TaxID=2494373 RepID=A0A3S9P477_9BACT|nr:fumarate reductase/succinate dehydrogenase flavoprotein subunit [Flammeovirga pectinis]AZQ62882.1 fumarate reductase/succinate dehydrogenase flavoprotein subunit [Flammeovirga pectinis]